MRNPGTDSLDPLPLDGSLAAYLDHGICSLGNTPAFPESALFWESY